jgi:hypothetical protein
MIRSHLIRSSSGLLIQLGNKHQGITKLNESGLGSVVPENLLGEGFECDQKEYGCHAKTVQNEGRCQLSRNVRMGQSVKK